MKLSNLEIFGFKSFVDRTKAGFDQQMTGVVGPNGCGKSNVVDAVRWVLGEQSAKSLRGGSMTDVIFNGSEARPPLNMAEVILRIENDGRDVPERYAAFKEIEVCRRLYRSGESEYLINRRKVRLLDVRDLFLGTGSGSRAYSIIEQGEVGSLVAARPEDRRRIIEEAAGITRYYQKKRMALQKLERTVQNLEKVDVALREKEKLIRSLKRQAAQARRFKQIQDEARDLDLKISAWALHDRLIEVETLQGRKRSQQAEADAAQTALTALTSRRAGLELRAVEYEQTVTGLRREEAELESAMRLNTAERGHLTEVMRSEAAAQQRLAAEQAQLEGEIGRLAAEGQAIEERAAALEQSYQRLRSEEAGLAGDLQAGLRAEEAALTRFERLRAVVFEAAGRIDQGRSRVETHQQRAAEAEAERDRLGARLTEAAAEQKRVRDDRTQLAASRDRQRQLRLDLDGRLQALDRELDGRRRDLAGTEEQIRDIEKGLTADRSVAAAYRQMILGNEGYDEGVRAFVEKLGQRPEVLGLLGARIEAPPGLERAVAAVLEGRFGLVVVEDRAAALALLEQYEEYDSIALAAAGPEMGAPRPAVTGRRLIDMIRVPETISGLIEALIGNVRLVDERDEAASAWAAGEGAFVTPEGEYFGTAGTLAWGTRRSSGEQILARRNELERLDELIADSQVRLQDAGSRAEAARQALADTARSREEMWSNCLEGQARERDLERHLAVAVSEAGAVDRRVEELNRAVRDAGRRYDEAMQAAREAASDLLGFEQEARRAEGEMAAARGAHQQASETSAALRDTVSGLRTEISVVREKVSGVNRERQITGRMLSEKRTRLTEAASGLEQSIRRAAEAERLTAEGERHFAGMEASLDACRQRLQTGLSVLDGVRGELEEAARAASGELERLREQERGLQQTELAAHDARSEVRHLQDSIRERYRLELSSIYQNHAAGERPTPEEAVRLEDLRTILVRIGGVNLAAIEEADQVEQEYDLVKRQRDDLEASVSSLRETIREIDRLTRRNFKETFDAIAEKFREVFQRLFEGGVGELVLDDPENLLETGVDIIVRPKGKRAATVSLLSGGEKALAAISLIFSIFLIKPSPFCILDEVDAPLDEMNIMRFIALVRSISEHSQMIIITHNKRTMEAADVLYGVTMEEPGVSKMVSVNLSARGGR